MDGEQPGQPQLPRKRGRPPGSKKKREIVSSTPSLDTHSVSSASQFIEESHDIVFDEERLAYTRAEEKLSPFSSLLRHILHHNRTEISRVAHEMDVAEITVYRWMNGSSDPRLVHLKRLVEVLPEHRGNLTYVINQTFNDALSNQATGVRDVSKEMYRRVLDLVTITEEDDARHWQVTQAIFDGAMLQLDSERHGLAITYAQLMPAHEDGVHSLREMSMRGHYPWPHEFESRAFLGSTTLAGTAAMTQRLQTWDNLSNEERLMVDIDEFERSAAACPIIHGGRIAGVLIVSSSQVGFFTDKVACQSVVEYAQLMALGLSENDFYDPALLNLRPMPSLRWQRTELDHSYLNRIITYARKYTVSRQEAEHRVVLEMEREFEERGRASSDANLFPDERNESSHGRNESSHGRNELRPYTAPHTSYPSSDTLF